MMSPESGEPNPGTTAGDGPQRLIEVASPHHEAMEAEAMDTDNNKQEDSIEATKFAGKILYNPDGSTYIIDQDADLGDNELPKQEGCFVDDAREASMEDKSYPQIANAFVVSRSSAYYNALYGQAFVKLLQDRNVPETPVVHSYRVYSVRNRADQEPTVTNNKEMTTEKPPLPTLVPVKPILMCFICKLSFGCAKTFASHCRDMHSLVLTEQEQSILDARNSSAIVQYVGKDQEVSISFLEPESNSNSNGGAIQSNPMASLASLIQSNKQPQQPGSAIPPSSGGPMSPGAIANFLSVAAAVQQAKASGSSLQALPTTVPSDGEDSLMQPPSVGNCKPEEELVESRSPSNFGTRYSSPSPSSSSSFNQLPMTSTMTVTNANMLQGTTIGACPDHVNGRPTGVECTKCDLILSSSRMAGGNTWNVSRNSCKTLKCPKCNWHYKYQETLEIHMKEKHPESETTCIYCITGQQHPRLARGETYTCGYKPYRCEVCNYSTTTKGNLSIHMQSDKHLNNMQELQNGGPALAATDATKISSSQIIPNVNNRGGAGGAASSGGGGGMTLPLPPTMSPNKQPQSPSPKPTWRCDVCNYDTNVARNLRIHMTSEKHTHNMMALSQQKNMQHLSALQSLIPGMDPKQLLQFGMLAGGPAANPPPTSEAALADLAFNQAVLAQMMSGGQLPPPTSGGMPSPADLNLAAIAAAAAASGAASLNEDSMEALQEQQQQEFQNAKTMFSCCVCMDFGTDSIDELSAHLSLDRSRTREHEVSLFIGGHYLCQLCNYKTNLKANFQLHCKTDKHLQRLSHVNHIKEGGPSNEWKLRFLTSINPVELRCNACDFYTNSPHKLQVHVANQQHQAAAVLFTHLQKMEASIEEEKRAYNCTLCKFSSPGKPALMGHVRTMKHLQMEQIHQLQKRAEGNTSHTEIGDIFQVTENSAVELDHSSERPNNNDDPRGDEERESTQFTTGAAGHAESGGSIPGGEDHQQQNLGADELPDTEESNQGSSLQMSCPLCSEKFPSQDRLESHAMSVHSVNSEGLQRLQSLINGSHWLNKKSEGEQSGDPENNSNAEKKQNQPQQQQPNFSYSLEKYMDPNRPFKCEVCKESFTQKNILLVHYNSVSHLHRLKKSLQQQGSGSGQESSLTSGQPIATSSAAEVTPTAQMETPEKSSKKSALEALLGNIRGEKKDHEDNEAKPFKCNICKVAYSQGSTLDIHIRSVLHQTKASKLQEMIQTGQIDMSKPLIEQPEPQQLQEQHKKMIADILLSPKSLNSTGSSNPQTSPNLRSSSPERNHNSPQSSPLATIQSMMSGAKSEDEELMMKNLAKTFPMLSHLTSTPTSDKTSGGAVLGEEDQANKMLDLVKQFTEMQQKRQRAEAAAAAGDTDGQPPEAKKSKSEFDNSGTRMNGGEESPARDISTPTSVDNNGSNNESKLGEMQEMLQRAMMGAQLQQMNPLMMQMASLQGLNPLMTMNLYPPLIPPNLLKQGGAGNDALAQLQANHPLLGASGLDPKLLALMSAARGGSSAGALPETPAPQQPPKNLAQIMGLLNQAPPMPPISQPGGETKPVFPAGFPAPPPNFTMPRPDQAPGGLMLPQQPVMQHEGKRARTRISDDQLKILRANFDINNSPTEDTLNKMAQQTGLPLKVIKHWFRNTLFKERQKNKDSPYNFNNPPSTKLNLEEYEKTGEPLVTPLNPSDQEEYIRQEAAKKEIDGKIDMSMGALPKREGSVEKSESPLNASPKVPTTPPAVSVNVTNSSSTSMAEAGLTLQRLLGSHLTPGALGGQPPPLLPNFPAFPLTTMSSSMPTTPPLPDYLSNLARSNPRPQSPQSVGSGQGKRANRTRFTDYQIKVLQEFFENNAYPKDDDLEYLSKLLGLSPRVIVVWFQNARQKARKIYENQPPAEAQGGGGGGGEGDEASGRFTRTSGCNYQCKKCLLVFQRYYELIRHQKQHCYKEEDARRSAQAQKAAAVAAAQFVGPPPPLIPHSEESRSSNGGDERSLTSPAINDQDNAIEPRTSILNFPPHTPFGILQQQALQQQQQQQQQQQLQLNLSGNPGNESGDDFDESESLASSPSSKRKLSDDGDLDEETLQHREKRLRTTIVPEQLDFLYQKYQVESNPSRKMLEQIANEVGLRKRVVQVWFQNTRARERKGQFRINGGEHQSPSQQQNGGGGQAICKKCPFCSAIFKVRTALEAHLGTQHPDQPTGIVDIDALPNIESVLSEDDGEQPSNNHQDIHSPDSGTPNPSIPVVPMIPTTNGIGVSEFQNSMRKYYEDTMKRFMNDLADQKQHYPNDSASPINNLSSGDRAALAGLNMNLNQQALDLTSSFNNDDDVHHGDGDSDQNNHSLESNGGSKRFRTQMSGVQVKMMKAIFEAYKTPTMTECSTLGREIGLQKRVVQVWFQNARAKEKRARLQLQQATGREPEGPITPEQCIVCPGVTFGQRFAIQDHLFTKPHLEHLKLALEQGRYDPESPGTAMAQAAAALSQQNGGGGGVSPNVNGEGPPGGPGGPLSMLQMTTQVNNSHELLDIPNRPNPRMLMQV